MCPRCQGLGTDLTTEGEGFGDRQTRGAESQGRHCLTFGQKGLLAPGDSRAGGGTWMMMGLQLSPQGQQDSARLPARLGDSAGDHPWSSRKPLIPQLSSRVPPGPSRAVTMLVAPREPKPPPQGRLLPSKPLWAHWSRGNPPPSTATAAGGASARGGGGWLSPRPCWPPARPAPRLPGTSGTRHTSGRAQPGAGAFPF